MLRDTLSLLDHRERWKLALLLVLATLSGLVQVTGVGAVMPFVGVLTNPELIQENSFLRWLYGVFGSPSTNAFLMILGAGVLLASVLSNALLVFTQWYTFRFARWNQYRLSRRLLQAYLNKPYIYHLQHNSADAGRNLLMESQTFTQQLLLPGLQAVAFGVSALLIAGFLVWLSPLLAAIALGVIGGAYGLIYLALRRRLRRLGERRLQANRGRFKTANEAFGAIKEVKAAGTEGAFLARYDPEAKRFAQAQASQQVIGQVPRYMVEVVSVGSILLVVMLLLMRGESAATIVPVVSVYAVAGYRLYPALQRIYLGISQLRTNAPVADALRADLSPLPEVVPRPGAIPRPEAFALSDRFSFTRAVELRDVTFTYPGRDTPALDHVQLTIPRAGSLALIGETGAGKTTLADVILGLLRPQQGHVVVDDVVLTEENLSRWRREIGYVPQHIYLTDDTVANNIAFGIPRAEVERDRVERAARIANIHDFVAGSLPRGYNTVVGERGVRLSGGQRQRLGIARALYHDPEVLVLDEATSALDNATEAAVQRAIDRVAEAKTLIIIAHRLTTVRQCELVCLLRHGQIAALGAYDEVIEKHVPFQAIA